MSNRQARRARKQAQRDGHDAYIHTGPTSGTHRYETRRDAKRRRSDENAAAVAAQATLFGRAGIARALLSTLPNSAPRASSRQVQA